MSTALFQCIDESTAVNVGQAVMTSQLWSSCRVYPFGRLLGVFFMADCREFYNFCMHVVSQSPGVAAFIGIDVYESTPDDPYKLQILTTMPYLQSIRNNTEVRYYNLLVKDFLRSIQKYEYDYQSVLNVVSRCFLGQDEANSVETIARTIYYLANSNLRRINTTMLIENAGVTSNSDAGFRLMIRCMAHFCYLNLHKFGNG